MGSTSPQTQGKIERYHRTMKNVVKLDHYYLPRELKEAIGRFVTHYNNDRLHESLDNVTPADVYLWKKGGDRNSENHYQTKNASTEEAL